MLKLERMSSQAPAVSETQNLKPSFAKVAASAYMPHNTKDVSSPPKTAPAPQAPVILQKPSSPSDSMNAQIAGSHVENGVSEDIPSQEPNADINGSSKEGHAQNGASPDSNPGQPTHSTGGAVKPAVADDSATQVSSSNSSVKPPSVDGKSVASGTTFALDEKESIRPDDSASIRAVEEDREDIFTPPDSVAAGSRVGSENGIGRAFRDQLNEISVMGASAQRVILPGRSSHGMSASEVAQARPTPLPLGAIQENDGSSQPQPVPDEKLLEALQSPRDRLFVLKLEQDVLDFLRNTGEKELDVPNCNAFYRMLAHRFADYYLLGHVVDPVTSAVKITKTPYSRMPPPLSSLPSSLSSGPETPPIIVPARKIMRRGESGGTPSGTNTTANSEGPSKTTSEAGADSGSDAGQGPRKLTREEREAKYKEARQRIFGSAEDGDLGESANNESKDMSRSSSAAGKKNKKKNRNNDDDGFEARSQFSPYYPAQYGGSGYSSDAPPMYYGPYTNMVPPPANMNPTASGPMQYTNGYPVMVQQEPQPQPQPQQQPQQFSWQYQQFGSPNGSMNAVPYGAPMPMNYDISADFQQRMTFQPGNASNQTPKMSNPPLAAFPEGYRPQSQGMNQSWQMPGQMPYQFAQQGFDNRPMSAGQNPYPYGQLPNPQFGNSRNQHPLPGSFNRQQFNPQSQAFVPSFIPGMRPGAGFGMPGQSPQMGPVAPNMVNFPPNFNMPMHQQPPRPNQPTSQPQFNRQPGNPAFVKNPQGQGMAHPLPQPVSAAHNQGQRSASGSSQSSIAKWGTPAHLPPKPPPPASMQPSQKFANGPPSRVPSGPPPQQNPNGTYPIPSIMGSGGGAGNGARAAK